MKASFAFTTSADGVSNRGQTIIFPRIAFDLNHGRSRPDSMSLLLCIWASCRRQLLGLLLILCASTYLFAAPVSSQPPQAEIQGRSSEWLVGTTLELVSETDILYLRFANTDWVAVTTGKKGGQSQPQFSLGTSRMDSFFLGSRHWRRTGLSSFHYRGARSSLA